MATRVCSLFFPSVPLNSQLLPITNITTIITTKEREKKESKNRMKL